MTGRRRAVLGALVAVVLVGVVVVAIGMGRDDEQAPVAAGSTGGGSVAAGPVPGPPDAALSEVDVASLTAGVYQGDVAVLNPIRLAEGLVPPTNRWFSGLVFDAGPQPVFPRPLSVGLTTSGVTVGLPEPVTTGAAVVGPHVPSVTVGTGTVDYEVVAYDDASVTAALLDSAGTAVGRVVIVQGSPFLSLTADEAGPGLTVTTDVPFVVDDDGVGTATVRDRTWRLVASAPQAGASGEDDVSSSEVGLEAGATVTSTTLEPGSTLTWYPEPDGLDAAGAETLVRAAADPVTGTAATYGVGDGVARTSVAYRTAAGTETVHVTMPHHRRGEQPERTSCGLGTYPSVYGTLELCSGSVLTSWAPTVDPDGTLDLTGLSEERRATIVESLRTDVAETGDFPADTYFGGKALHRAAVLVGLGQALGAEDVVADLRTRAVAALREWAEPEGCAQRQERCFAYDASAAAVVGLVPSFGSDELNDHHFHYGYLLSAAGMLAADDPELAADLAPVMDLLAQDVAAAVGTEHLPRLRVFDVYAGHSWASGTAPFADGNNQESASEAVNAWNGLALWARASGQAELEVQATWLLSTEAASARAYWTDLDLDDPVYEGFAHQVVALNWGGKRDWATWFSAEPNAMLGILLIPMPPVVQAIAAEPERIRASVDEAAPQGYGVQFGDYLLMYRALAGPSDAEEAWDLAQNLPDVAIDDGSSRAYLLAWIAVAGG